MAIPGGMMDRVIQARKQQPGYNPNILGPLGQLMTGVGNLIQGRPYGTSFTGVGNIPPSARGESYRRAELRLADAARPGGGGGGGGNAGYSGASFSSPAAERAYQQEASRVAQLTAQDPELQRYEKARASAKSQQEMDAARDIGMAIWARSNPELAKKVKPGQSGYEVIQNEINAGQMGPVKDFPFDTTRPLAPTPVPPEQRNVTYQGASPVPIPGAAPVVPVAFGTPQTQMFENFRQAIAPGASLQSAPLGGSPMTNIPSYGAQLGNPLGTAVDTDAFRSDKARELAELFKNAQMVR